MPRNRIVSVRQLDELLRLLQENPDVANGRIVAGALGHQRVLGFWEQVATSLNSVGDGVQKTGAQWKNYWHDLKYRAKKRAANVRSHATGTGGGPGIRALSDTENRILNIIGPVSYQGNPSVQIPVSFEIPIHHESQQEFVREVPVPEQISPATLSPVLPAARTQQASQNDARRQERVLPRRRRNERQSNFSDPPLWARRFEERRLTIDAQVAQSLNRIADAVEALLEDSRRRH